MCTTLHTAGSIFPAVWVRRGEKGGEEEERILREQVSKCAHWVTQSQGEPRHPFAPVSPATIPSWTNRKEIEIAKGSISFPLGKLRCTNNEKQPAKRKCGGEAEGHAGLRKVPEALGQPKGLSTPAASSIGCISTPRPLSGLLSIYPASLFPGPCLPGPTGSTPALPCPTGSTPALQAPPLPKLLMLQLQVPVQRLQTAVLSDEGLIL